VSRRQLAVVALLPVLAACGGGNDREATPSPVPSTAPNGLPPAFTECVEGQGYEVSSPNEIHTLPQAVLQSCFGSLHGGGGAPDSTAVLMRCAKASASLRAARSASGAISLPRPCPSSTLNTVSWVFHSPAGTRS
jgi:hypothetical protein